MIRLATTKDISAIQLIVYVTWNDTYDGMIPREVQDDYLSLEYANETLEENIENEEYWVVCDGDLIVGFMRAYIEEGVGVLRTIYILPTSQNAGFGRDMVLSIESLFQGHVPYYIADILFGSMRAREFFESLGFKHLENNSTLLGEVPLKTERYIKYL